LYTHFYLVFSFTSAVTTSLQYTVSNKLFEKDRTEQGYIYHVIITSLGLILGPVIGGRVLIDLTKKQMRENVRFF
jgi:hypothetical protein